MSPRQDDLFDSEVIERVRAARHDQWPDPQRMPLNTGSRTVADTVLADLRASRQPMIVTGYSSLAFLIEHLPGFEAARRGGIRLLIGNEPQDAPELGRPRPVPENMRQYWLRRGLSVRQAPKLAALLAMLREERICVRTLDDLHAKMYLADEAVALGSSNFSHAGFARMLEANVRFAARETARCREVRQTAENFWERGRPFNEGLTALLEDLLRATSFEEAVAFACAGLLEGDWAAEALNELERSESVRLWPSQRQGIARALWILENEGSVLIADATGAGKTRMGCSLLGALQRLMWRRGRMQNGLFLMIAPRGVIGHWERERSLAGLNLQIWSDGIVSSERANRHEQALRDIRHAQCLAVDEAHHFLNRSSQRTRHMLGNLADHVVLFTATPINRGVRDILSLVDLLGADNLDDQALGFFDELEQRLKRAGSGFSLSPEERRRLQRLLGRFVLRRTKRDLKSAIESEPEAYRDDAGHLCRYPEHCGHTYRLNETERDRKLAKEIRELAGTLKGLIQFQGEIRKPAFYHGDHASYVRGRLRIANALTVYRVMSALRSSRAAAIEHLRGTACACERFGIEGAFKTEETGDEIGKLARLAGRVPDCAFAEQLPEWLQSPEAHRRAVEEEIRTLEAIEERIMAISDAREHAREQLLLELYQTHSHVLAFDSRLISLAMMRQRLQGRLAADEVLLASGDADSDRKALERRFALGSTEGAIALCSDAVSEGVNLQQASALVLLDLPSVIRIAEQRIGRIDRLNSPHAQVHIYWPEDAQEFALKSDRKFLQRHLDVGALIGANIEVPDELMGEALAQGERVPDSASDMMEAVEQGVADETSGGVMDALAPVRDLVEGESAIVSPETYRDIRSMSRADGMSFVAVVESSRPWAFFAVSGVRPEGGGRGWAPKWVWFDGPDAEPITDFADIAARLRAVAQEGLREPEPERGERIRERMLEAFARRLDGIERELLPRRRRRALDQMREVLDEWRRTGIEAAATANELLKLMNREAMPDCAPHWHALADAWMMATSEAWLSLLQQRKKRLKPLRLKDMTRFLKRHPLPDGRLRELLGQFGFVPAASARAMVSIIAVPSEEDD